MDQRGRGGSKLLKANKDSFYEYDAEKYHDSSHIDRQYICSKIIKIVLFVVMIFVSCFVISQSTYPTYNFFEMPYLLLASKINNESAPLLLSVDDHPIVDMNASSLSNDSAAVLVNSSSFHQLVSENLPGNEDLGLDEILKKAAMPADKTVIIVTLNEAWTEPNSIFDLFLTSFRIGNQTVELLKHLVVVALDQKALDHCLGLNLNCYFMTTINGADFSHEAGFMTTNYMKMSWEKIDFLRIVLEKGYSFIYTDADIMWFRNPFPHFYSEGDFQISCDNFHGNPSDLDNAPNTGLKYVKSTNETIEFYKFWYKSRETYHDKNDQFAFNEIKHDPFVRRIGLQIKFLDTAYYGGFCQPSKDLNLVCTMHANCCGSLKIKLRDLNILLDDWRKYISLPENVRKSKPHSWSVTSFGKLH